MTNTNKPLRLGILLSGGGRTMQNLTDVIAQGQLNADIALVISSRSNVAGVQRARSLGLVPRIMPRKEYPTIEAFSTAIGKEFDVAQVDLVLQCGWLCFWKIPPQYRGRVMNIHPSLLPSFGGKGMFGHHVHEAVLATGCKVSGVTVHFVTDEYDAGPIIIQRCCPVAEDDDPDTLAARVFEQECIAYPQAVQLYAQDKLSIQGPRVRVLP